MKQLLSTPQRVRYIAMALALAVCAIFLAKPAVSAYYSSRWLDAVIKELGWAKRRLDLTPQQQALWNEGEDEFRQLLESMRGKRDKIREMYERAAADAETGKDYDWINAEIATHWYDMMESHSKVVARWHAFDQSLNVEQRKTFRSSMRDLVVKDWEHFSNRWNRYLTQQSQLTQAMGERFIRNPTASDKALAERTFANMKAVSDEYEKKRKQSVQAVDQIMQNPNLPLTDINPLAESNWHGFETSLREIYGLSRDYYQNNSMGQLFKDNKGKLAAAAFRKQREMTPASYNN